MLFIRRITFALSIISICSLETMDARADEAGVFVLGGDTCHVRNPTTRNAAGLRRIDGTLKNISEELTATVFCPIPLTFPVEGLNQELFGADIGISVSFLNSNPLRQAFECERYRVNSSGGKSPAYPGNSSASANIGSGDIGRLEFDPDRAIVGIRSYRSLGSQRPVLMCELPPLSAILEIVVEWDTLGFVTPP
jgi:hypothetical protein